MIEIFENYTWNLATNIALNTGGHPAEVLAACRPVLDAANNGDDDGTATFFSSWCAVADRLVELAEADEQRGRLLSAGTKLRRAAVYYTTAERMQSRDYAPRKQAYARMLSSFTRSLRLSGDPGEQVEIPYEGTTLPALHVPAEGEGPSPCMVFCNGLDSTKEMIHGSGLAQRLRRRGIATLIVDQPGTGAALRLQGLTGYAESERWAGPCADFLTTREDVDPGRLGVMGWSLGGYYAPRAAAFEKRFTLCVAWGANSDWGAVQRRRRAREGDRPVPHYWEHVRWVFGQDSVEDFLVFAESMTLRGVLDRITVPFLTTHGANDRQIPAEFATAQYDGAVNSPRRELKWFTAAEGGVEHVSADNMTNAADYIADWIAETI